MTHTSGLAGSGEGGADDQVEGGEGAASGGAGLEDFLEGVGLRDPDGCEARVVEGVVFGASLATEEAVVGSSFGGGDVVGPLGVVDKVDLLGSAG